jgi:hypothetical protein
VLPEDIGDICSISSQASRIIFHTKDLGGQIQHNGGLRRSRGVGRSEWRRLLHRGVIVRGSVPVPEVETTDTTMPSEMISNW